jgi:hypothetical protein
MATTWPRSTRVLSAVLGSLLVGCAALPSQPSLPAGIDLQQAVVEPLGVVPEVQLEEAGWKSRSTGTAGMAGAGIGLGLGGLACMGTGPLAPLCLGTVIPLTTAVGAVGGAAAGAAYSHHAPGVEDKRKLLQQEWAALIGRAPLVDALHRRWPLPARDPVAVSAAERPAPWRLQAGYATLGTVGAGLDQPFALEATARLVVSRPADLRPAVERTYVSQSPNRLTLAQWRADDALALRRTLDALADMLAAQIAEDVARAAP